MAVDRNHDEELRERLTALMAESRELHVRAAQVIEHARELVRFSNEIREARAAQRRQLLLDRASAALKIVKASNPPVLPFRAHSQRTITKRSKARKLAR